MERAREVLASVQGERARWCATCGKRRARERTQPGRVFPERRLCLDQPYYRIGSVATLVKMYESGKLGAF